MRHGESTCNEAHRFAGSADAPLTRLGRAQADEAARCWSRQGRRVDLILHSPLQRAAETAARIVPREAGTPRRSDDRLRERDFGRFTLRSKAELLRERGVRGFDQALYGLEDPIEAAEPAAGFEARLREVLDQVVVPELRAGRRVLLVAHKYVIEFLAREILGTGGRDDFDLRLPTAQVVSGDRLREFFGRESRRRNRARELVVLHHGGLIAAAALLGLVVGSLGGRVPASPWFALLALMLASTISGLRIDLRAPAEEGISWHTGVLRYLLLPLGVAVLAPLGPDPSLGSSLALVLAAPAGWTALTTSRCLGGDPSAVARGLLRSTLIGPIAMTLLLAGGERPGTAIASVALVATAGLAIPLGGAAALRRHRPLLAGRWADRHAALAVLALASLAFTAATRLRLDDGLATPLLAVLVCLGLRGGAALLARRGSRRGLDDFLSLSAPNLFLLMVLAEVLDDPRLVSLSGWCLLPTFLLLPLDQRWAGRWRGSREELREWLRIPARSG